MSNLIQQQSYTPFVKPYVEGAVKEFTDLQNRLVKDYDESVLMYDSLQEAAENARSLDAEGDIMQKNKAFELAMLHINEAAKEGNYEDRGRIVRKAIKDFSTTYRPVAEAMQERQADIEAIKKFDKRQDKNSFIATKEKLYRESGGLKQDPNGTWKSWNDATNRLQLMEDIDLFEGLKKAVGDYVAGKSDKTYEEIVKAGDFKNMKAKIQTAITDNNDMQLKQIMEKYLTSPEVVNYLNQEGFIKSTLSTNKDAFESHAINYLAAKGNVVGKAINNNLQILKKTNPETYNQVAEKGYNGLKGKEALNAWSADSLKAKGINVDMPEINDINDLRELQARDYTENQIHEWTGIGLLKYANDEIKTSVTYDALPDYISGLFTNPEGIPKIGVPTDVGVIRQGEITPTQFLEQAETPVLNEINSGIQGANQGWSTDINSATLLSKPIEEKINVYRTTPAYKNKSIDEKRKFEQDYINYSATKQTYNIARNTAKNQAGLTDKEEKEYNKLKNFIGDSWSLNDFFNGDYNTGQVRIINGERVSFNTKELNNIKDKIKVYEENLAKNIKNSAKSLANYRYNHLGEGELAQVTHKLAKELTTTEFLNTNANVIGGYSKEHGSNARLSVLLGGDAANKSITLTYMPKGIPQLGNKPSIVYTVSNKDGLNPKQLFVPYDTESLQNANIPYVFETLQKNYPIEYAIANANVSNGVVPITLTEPLMYPDGKQNPSAIKSVMDKSGKMVEPKLGDELMVVVKEGKVVQVVKN
jgi:hypothetical protein